MRRKGRAAWVPLALRNRRGLVGVDGRKHGTWAASDLCSVSVQTRKAQVWYCLVASLYWLTADHPLWDRPMQYINYLSISIRCILYKRRQKKLWSESCKSIVLHLSMTLRQTRINFSPLARTSHVRPRNKVRRCSIKQSQDPPNRSVGQLTRSSCPMTSQRSSGSSWRLKSRGRWSSVRFRSFEKFLQTNQSSRRRQSFQCVCSRHPWWQPEYFFQPSRTWLWAVNGTYAGNNQPWISSYKHL